MIITCKVTIDLYLLDDIYSRDLEIYNYRQYSDAKDFKMKFKMKIIAVDENNEQIYDALACKEIDDNRKNEGHYLSFHNITYKFNNTTLELVSETLEHEI